MAHIDDIIELSETPNVKYVLDAAGRGHFCSGALDSRTGPGEGCVPADEWPYDRSFGG